MQRRYSYAMGSGGHRSVSNRSIAAPMPGHAEKEESHPGRTGKPSWIIKHHGCKSWHDTIGSSGGMAGIIGAYGTRKKFGIVRICEKTCILALTPPLLPVSVMMMSRCVLPSTASMQSACIDPFLLPSTLICLLAACRAGALREDVLLPFSIDTGLITGAPA